jgi:phenylacetate-CoA ligase
VVRYQVVQRSLDALELAIVRGPGFEDGALERIRAEVAAVLGPQARLDIHLVDRIATPANGKFRVTINAIDRTGAGS